MQMIGRFLYSDCHWDQVGEKRSQSEIPRPYLGIRSEAEKEVEKESI